MQPITFSKAFRSVRNAVRKGSRDGKGVIPRLILAGVCLMAASSAFAQDNPDSGAAGQSAENLFPVAQQPPQALPLADEPPPDVTQEAPVADPGNIGLPEYQDLVRRLQQAEAEIHALKGGVTGVNHEPLDANEASYAAPAGPGGKHDDASISQQLSTLQNQFAEFKSGLGKIKYPTVEVHGVFQVDSGWFNQDSKSIAAVGNIQDGADFRRARMSANGAVTENFNYFFQMDYAFPGRPTFTDVWGELTKVPLASNVRFGQWKQPFSLEVVSSFRYTTFAERSVLFQAFTPFRHIAVGMYDWAENERMTWAASVYRPGQDQFGDQIADSGGYAGVGRFTCLPWYDEESGGCRFLHLGGAYNYVAPANRTTRFRTIPEYFIGETAGVTPTGTSGIAVPGNINGTPFFVDTKAFGVNHYNLYGTELLFVENQFSLQTEFMFTQADRTNGVQAYFPGMYITGGYFLTGEHRPYLKKAGAIDRVKVLRNLLSHDDCGTGFGAWEVAARYSYIDLNSKDIQGGRLNDVTVGLNWYLNPYVKVQFNYIRAMLDNPMLGRNNTDTFGLRAQVDF